LLMAQAPRGILRGIVWGIMTSQIALFPECRRQLYWLIQERLFHRNQVVLTIMHVCRYLKDCVKP